MSVRLTALAQLRSLRRALSVPARHVSGVEETARGGPTFRATVLVTVCSTANETDVANL
jgi:hypothetical protein